MIPIPYFLFIDPCPVFLYRLIVSSSCSFQPIAVNIRETFWYRRISPSSLSIPENPQCCFLHMHSSLKYNVFAHQRQPCSIHSSNSKRQYAMFSSDHVFLSVKSITIYITVNMGHFLFQKPSILFTAYCVPRL